MFLQASPNAVRSLGDGFELGQRIGALPQGGQTAEEDPQGDEARAREHQEEGVLRER